MVLKSRLKSRLGTATFTQGENSIKLQANLANMRSLEEATGMDLYTYTGNVKTPLSLATMFYHLQLPDEGYEPETEDDIFAAFFTDLNVFVTADFAKQMEEVICILIGVDTQMLLKVSDSKKNPLASSSTKLPLET